MNRREILGAGVMLAAVGIGARAGEHAQHHHGHGPTFIKNPLLLEAATACVNTGQACISHCLELFAQGAKELAACARSVTELATVCNALVGLTNMDSKYLAKAAHFAM